MLDCSRKVKEKTHRRRLHITPSFFSLDFSHFHRHGRIPNSNSLSLVFDFSYRWHPAAAAPKWNKWFFLSRKHLHFNFTYDSVNKFLFLWKFTSAPSFFIHSIQGVNRFLLHLQAFQYYVALFSSSCSSRSYKLWKLNFITYFGASLFFVLFFFEWEINKCCLKLMHVEKECDKVLEIKTLNE